ncbi:NADPH-dependent thioredoxin reductase 3 [Astathelohania contejeani]|uniref:NADPH-dependent thioredoxin reductase 3 n=1 Tax=Astathelohania contejeani TaxID=164912 RepID=A0ABQ7I0U7_9MICR|nr:NADPH-dependent thioredoxin reductase 3 [Thelohania contejeani]
MKTENVIIVGNGAGALMAAIYTATSNHAPLVLQTPDWQDNISTSTINIAGLDGLTNPNQLIQLMTEQSKRFDVRINSMKVDTIIIGEIIQVKSKEEIKFAKTLIIDSEDLARKLIRTGFETTEDGQLILDGKVIPNVFICGSRRHIPNEAIVYAGSGCMCALNANEYLASLS